MARVTEMLLVKVGHKSEFDLISEIFVMIKNDVSLVSNMLCTADRFYKTAVNQPKAYFQLILPRGKRWPTSHMWSIFN